MVQYIFRGNNAAGFVTVGGVRFEKDNPADIADEAWIAKLDANPEFERAGAGPTEASPPPFGGPPSDRAMGPTDDVPEGATDEGPRRKGRKSEPHEGA